MIVVLDIGKTNKKILVFDERLKVVEKITASFSEYEKDGVRYEQPEEIYKWFIATLKELSKGYKISDISVTAHGASLVCVDEFGELALPPVAYTTDAGEDFDDTFYQRFGDVESLQGETSTAKIGSLVNIAKLIFYLQQRYPEKYCDVDKILFYPQYFVYKLTGYAVIEPTYLGCHTYLYDFAKGDFSRVVDELGIRDKLPEIVDTCSVAGSLCEEVVAATGLPAECRVTSGIHDSNSSLLPHIVENENDFILNSTGTWCVMMNRAGNGRLVSDEMGKTIFYNIDPFRTPVKTAVFMGGREYEVYSKLIENCFGRTGLPEFDEELYKRVLEEADSFFIPSVEVGVGIFPQSRPRVITAEGDYSLEEITENMESAERAFGCYERAFAVLNCSLWAQTVIGMNYLDKDGNNPQLMIEGGFRNNLPYCILLASYYKQTDVYLTSLEEATAIGAALQSVLAAQRKSFADLKSLISMQRQKVDGLEGLLFSNYLDKFSGYANL